ncbi:MAG: FHA domain-containing protein [Deltaproteobacteria bacterium]|nr:FHA domain-containing protein [Deltaproteobacteria bacterium]
MTDKKDTSDMVGSYTESDSVELFDDIFSEQIDDSTEKPSEKDMGISNADIRDVACRLNIVTGPLKGNSFEISKEVTFIGRTQDNDIEINDRTISRKHLKITRKNNRFFIEDLGSHNGLAVDSNRVESFEEIELVEGRVYSIGDTAFSIVRLGNCS